MKVFVPRNIKGGWFNMNLQFGPLTINLIQLFIIAGGTALALVVWNSIIKSGGTKLLATILASPIFLIFAFIAFFERSELRIIPFLAKIIKTYFLDETRKYQVNYQGIDPNEIKIKLLKTGERKQIMETKNAIFDEEKLKNFDKFLD